MCIRDRRDRSTWEKVNLCFGEKECVANIKIGSVSSRTGTSNMNVFGINANGGLYSTVNQLQIRNYAVVLSNQPYLELHPKLDSDDKHLMRYRSSPGSGVDICVKLRSLTIAGRSINLMRGMLLCLDTGSNVMSFPSHMKRELDETSGKMLFTAEGLRGNDVPLHLNASTSSRILYHSNRVDRNVIIVGTPALKGNKMIVDTTSKIVKLEKV